VWFVGRPGEWLYHGGFPLLAIGAALILASSAAPTPSRLNRALGWAPLVLIGQVSYGIYLWHWPVFSVLGPEQLHVRGWQLLVSRLAITAVLVMISYVLVERPYRFRRGSTHIRFLGAARLRRRRDRSRAGLADRRPGERGPSGQRDRQAHPAEPPGVNVPTATTAAPPTGPATTTATTPAPTVRPPSRRRSPPIRRRPRFPNDRRPPTAPPPVFPAPRRLLVVGDSVADTMRRSFSHQVPPGMAVKDVGRSAARRRSRPPAGPLLHRRRDPGPVRRRGHGMAGAGGRRPLRRRAHGVRRLGLDRQFGDQWLRPCDAEYSVVPGRDGDQPARPAGAGRPVWSLAPSTGTDVAAPRRQAAADRQTDCLNDMYAGARARSGASPSSTCAGSSRHPSTCTTQIDGIELRPDGLHFAGEGADIIARWLMEQLGPPPG
jgi:hypothetical protein